MVDSSDRDLVLRTRNGEVNAFGELVRRYQVSVFNVCYRFLGERREAEDLAQESFIRAYKRLETFDVGRPFGPWIRRVAANLCINHLRRDELFSFHLEEERDIPMQTQEMDLEARHMQVERSEVVRAAIFGLPSQYRIVIELRHFHGLSYTEISTALEIPLSDVKSHLFRARKLLAKRLITNAYA
jgi:RNA polymerase sigma-70 factor (ECF subfamily)